MSSRVTGIVYGMGRVVGFTAAAVILPLAVALWPGYRLAAGGGGHVVLPD
jgi:hypothetical protein